MIRTCIRIGAAALLAGASPAAAQNALADWDTDADEVISAEEFNSGLSVDPEGDRFLEYDVDESGNLSAEEVVRGKFRRIDRNQDRFLDREEYEDEHERWYELDLLSWDEDDDEMLSEDEFATGAMEAAGADDTDMSGDISREEFTRGEFARYDTDGDGSLDQEEFQRFAETLPAMD